MYYHTFCITRIITAYYRDGPSLRESTGPSEDLGYARVPCYNTRKQGNLVKQNGNEVTYFRKMLIPLMK